MARSYFPSTFKKYCPRNKQKVDSGPGGDGGSQPGLTRAPCRADGAGASVGSLDPRVIQESGLTHTFLLQVWSHRQAAAASCLSQPDSRQQERGQDGHTFYTQHS